MADIFQNKKERYNINHAIFIIVALAWLESSWKDWTQLAPSQRVARLGEADMFIMV